MVPYGLLGEDLLRVLDADRRRKLQSQFRQSQTPSRLRVAVGRRLVVVGARLAGLSSASAKPRDVVRHVRA
jgi:hypothetical protein